MSEQVLKQFHEIEEKAKADSLSEVEIFKLVKEIDFSVLSIDEIEEIENSEVLPPSIIVNILREWMDKEDDNINQMASFLVYTNQISNEQLKSFVESVFIPAKRPDLTVHNVISVLGTANNTRDFVNPGKNGLIGLKSSQNMPKRELVNALSPIQTEVFGTFPVQGAFAQFTLPEYFEIKLTDYSIKTADRNFPRTWVVQVSNDDERWYDVDTQTNSTDLLSPNKEATFSVKNAPFAKHIKITQKDKNSNENLQFSFQQFDFSGVLRVAHPL